MESDRRGAATDVRREAGQDAGPPARGSAAAPRFDRHVGRRRSPRPGAAWGDDLQLRPGVDRRAHGRRRLRPAAQALVAEAARQGRQVCQRSFNFPPNGKFTVATTSWLRTAAGRSPEVPLRQVLARLRAAAAPSCPPPCSRRCGFLRVPTTPTPGQRPPTSSHLYLNQPRHVATAAPPRRSRSFSVSP